MGRPRGARQGQRLTIYLTPARLDKVGWDDPAGKIYDMIDELEEEDEDTEQRTGRAIDDSVPSGQGREDSAD